MRWMHHTKLGNEWSHILDSCNTHISRHKQIIEVCHKQNPLLNNSAHYMPILSLTRQQSQAKVIHEIPSNVGLTKLKHT